LGVPNLKAAEPGEPEDELHARIDGRLPPERAEAVDAYLAAHPELRERWSQYAEQRQALREAFAAQADGPIPTRLRVAHLLAEQRRQRHRQLARSAAVVGFFILGGIGGWTARDVVPDLTLSSSAALARAVLDDAIAAGGGTTKFQPVFVDDMIAGLLELLKRPETAGKTYEFGGPQVYSFKVLLELLLTALNRQRVLIPIPFALAEMQAALLELLPNPPLTRDQVRLLKTDKVVSGVEPTLGDLGVQPRPLEEFLAVFKGKYS
jgi:NADH dehydrogenase